MTVICFELLIEVFKVILTLLFLFQIMAHADEMQCSLTFYLDLI